MGLVVCMFLNQVQTVKERKKEAWVCQPFYSNFKYEPYPKHPSLSSSCQVIYDSYNIGAAGKD